MTGTKVFFGARISSLASALVNLERHDRGGSDGEAVERLIYRASVSPKAKQMIADAASSDPQIGELISAIREAAPPYNVSDAKKEGVSRASRLAQESAKKQKADKPSENKSSQGDDAQSKSNG